MKLINKLVILSCFAFIIFADLDVNINVNSSELKAKLKAAAQKIKEAIKNKKDFKDVDVSDLKTTLNIMKEGGEDNEMIKKIE